MSGTQELQADLERTGIEKNLRSSRKILKAEKSLFTKVEGGDEFYEMLVRLFSNNK